MELDKEKLGKVIDYSIDFFYIKILIEAIERIENPNDDEDICQALDDALIYYDEQWTIMKHHQSPENANLMEAFEETLNDIYKYISLINN